MPLMKKHKGAVSVLVLPHPVESTVIGVTRRQISVPSFLVHPE